MKLCEEKPKLSANNTMTLDEFSLVLDTYGNDRDNWPVETLAECESLLNSNFEARQLLQSHNQLAEALNRIPTPEFPGLESRVLNQYLPPRLRSPVDRLMEWLLPESSSVVGFWRPAMAACLPLVFGIVLGNYYSFGIDNSYEFDNWDDELLMIAFTDTETGQF